MKTRRGPKLKLATALPIALVAHKWHVTDRYARDLIAEGRASNPSWAEVGGMLETMELVIRGKCDSARALAVFKDALRTTQVEVPQIAAEDLDEFERSVVEEFVANSAEVGRDEP